MDFGVVRKAGDPDIGEADVVEVIVTTHHLGDPDTDGTPLHLVSEARLAHLLAIERAFRDVEMAVAALSRTYAVAS